MVEAIVQAAETSDIRPSRASCVCCDLRVPKRFIEEPELINAALENVEWRAPTATLAKEGELRAWPNDALQLLSLYLLTVEVQNHFVALINRHRHMHPCAIQVTPCAVGIDGEGIVFAVSAWPKRVPEDGKALADAKLE